MLSIIAVCLRGRGVVGADRTLRTQTRSRAVAARPEFQFSHRLALRNMYAYSPSNLPRKTYVCMYESRYLCVCVCVYSCMHVCVCVRVFISISIYLHVYVYL